MGYPAPVTVGSLSFIVDNTSERFPLDGLGGTTATSALNQTLGADLCVIEGFILNTYSAGSDLQLMNGNGVVVGPVFEIPDATQVGVFQPFGAVGQLHPFPVSAKLSSGAASYRVFYRVIWPM